MSARTPSALQGRIKQMVEQLALETEQAATSEALLNYLRFSAAFHEYSLHNTLLIFSQRPDATRVAGYRKWQRLGRQVKKGSKAIWILAPIIGRVTDDDDDERTAKVVTRFRSVPVFDIADTEGEPLPGAPVLTGKACDEDLALALTLFADGEGITVQTEAIGNGAMGLSRGGIIVIDESLEGADRFAVMAHEIGHELLRHRERRDELDRKAREIEAESVAWTVCQHFNVPCTAPAYLGLHGADAKDIVSRLGNIVGVIQKVIAGIEANLAQLAPQAVNG